MTQVQISGDMCQKVTLVHRFVATGVHTTRGVYVESSLQQEGLLGGDTNEWVRCVKSTPQYSRLLETQTSQGDCCAGSSHQLKGWLR